MEELIKQFLLTSFGKGYGGGFGDGFNHTCDSGAYASSGQGDCYGDGWGYANGTGYGTSNSGYGCGTSNSGYGCGNGYGIKSYNGHEAYIIDSIQTIIYSVHGNIARGATINSDLTLADCYIAKYEDYFAHGETAKQAMADAQSKAYQNKPIEERIDFVVKRYPDVDVPIEHSVLFSLHNFLTGSCLFGRQKFAKSHSLDPEHGTMTMREFINLTKDAFGGDNIRQLADAYKIKL